MPVKDKLKEGRFSVSEQIAIDYIVDHVMDLRSMTIKEIAQMTYVSSSTLIRIAHKLGYEGWTDLKNDLIKEEEIQMRNYKGLDANYPFSKEDTLYSIASKLSALKQDAIAETFDLIDPVVLHHVVRLLDGASRIVVFGMSHNRDLAREFAFNMRRIGRLVQIVDQPGELVYEAADMDPGMAAIVLSYSGYTKGVSEILPYLQRNRVPIVAITNQGESLLSRGADYSLRISSREKLDAKIASFGTSAAIEYVLDVLFAGIFSLRYEHNVEHMKRMQERIVPCRQMKIRFAKEKKE